MSGRGRDPLLRTGKYLSLILRHDPARAGLVLDPGGWTPVERVLSALAAAGLPATREHLQAVVAADAKGRYALAGDRIRANQGHSVPVDLGLPESEPPALLFHGTPERNVPAILREGLRRGQRHHVHLSTDEATADAVGSRRGRAVVLRVAAAAMHAEGHAFRRSANGVWLTDTVPARHLSVPDRPSGTHPTGF